MRFCCIRSEMLYTALEVSARKFLLFVSSHELLKRQEKINAQKAGCSVSVKKGETISLK